MKVGILAFHGDFAEHIEILRSLKHTPVEIRTLEDLKGIPKLIIPGGESTVMAAFLEMTGLAKEIQKRVRKKNLSVFGTCAGAILLAKKATGKHTPNTLGLIDLTVDRNAYGTQLDSFAATIKAKGIKKPMNVSFIRAPRFSNVGREARVLAEYQGSPILVEQGKVLVAAFHPEVRGETSLHEYFISL
ncbi:MAG TPA: pyridoxal 5'-phosphate synthase glutaminase subunit PdxT [Candidatus Peribacteraceae bacterium]|nr:pyridoxal 5'-phosphate synthase glutaminase subunit PdxT [Candidatus Peribacteraceae bacterium]